MSSIGGLLILALLGGFCAALSARTGVEAALLPLPTLGCVAVVLLIGGCLGVLPGALWLCLALLLAVGCLLAMKAGGNRCLAALQSPGLVLFLAGSALFWVLFAVNQPMFTQWDEFTAWGLAPKMLKETGIFYAADPVNLAAYQTYPATSLITYFYQGLSPEFSEWQCLAALDSLALACVCAAAGLSRKKWPAAVLLFGCGVLLPYFFSTIPAGTASTVYANAMADLPLAMLFGGALCVYFGAGPLAAAPALALLTMTKDIAFAYGLIAVFVLFVYELAGSPRQWLRHLGRSVLLAVPVLAVFLLWGRYCAAVDPNTTVGGAVGSGGMSYGAVLVGGVQQLLGIGREPKFAQIMDLMAHAFTGRRVCLLGSGLVTVLVITLVAAAAWFCAEQGAPRRRVLAVYAAMAFCFAALYVFHLILYFYNFAEPEALALKDYERYLSSYYLGWLLVMLCLLGRGSRARLTGLAVGGAAVCFAAVFLWRGVPVAGFWSGTDSLYTLRADVQRRAAVANEVLDWDDRVLVISQGDDATRWYYYKYELTAKVVNGYGGIYWGGEDKTHRWDSDFMNLVESLNWEKYDYQAVCNIHSLVDYLAEMDCQYLLIDRADDYLEQEFSPYFEGGLTPDMPATLYRFEGKDKALPFTPVAVAESGVSLWK